MEDNERQHPRDDEQQTPESSRPTASITWIAALFEGSLALIAIVVGYFVGHDPFSSVPSLAVGWLENIWALLWGVLAILPMLAGLLLIDRIQLRPFVRLRQFFRRIVVPLFRHTSLAGLALIAFLSGLGEELLFRGLIQDGIANWLGGSRGVWVGLIVSSLAFGLAHPATTTYAVLAAAVGFYLGGLFLVTGNLLAPITAHAVYNFVALIYLVRETRATI